MVVSHLHSNISASWRTDASIKLSAVASSLTTVSARAMLTAMIAGERDPQVLAQLAKGKMRIKIPQLVEALTGHFDVGHAQLACCSPWSWSKPRCTNSPVRCGSRSTQRDEPSQQEFGREHKRRLCTHSMHRLHVP